MRVKPKNGKLYAEVTLRDVVERSDVSDLPMLSEIKHLYEENDKLRELVKDMWHDGMCECDEYGACAECEYHFPESMRELGIEVDA